MARSKNSLTDVSPISGQLKSSFSNSERTQLTALNRSTGSLGNVTGSVNNTLQNFSYRDRSKLEIGGLFAEGLEKSGITTKNSGDVISSVVGSSIDNRKPFYRNTPSKEVDLSIPSNRIPSSRTSTPTTRMKKKRESLVGKDDLNYKGLTFPPELPEKSHAYLQMKLYEYRRPTSDQEGSVSPKENIYLPLPENLIQEFSVNYGEQDAGIFGVLASTDMINNTLGQIRNLKSDPVGAFQTALGVAADPGAVAKESALAGINLGFSTLSSASPAFGGLAGQEFGLVSNPHPSLFLQGVNLRSFTFSWKLVPRNNGESDTIKKIIQLLKDECLPKKNDFFLKYPKMIQPIILPEDREIGFDYKKCMMTSLSVNYNAEGTSAFFYNGKPVAVQLTIGLKEAELYLDDVEGEE